MDVREGVEPSSEGARLTGRGWAERSPEALARGRGICHDDRVNLAEIFAADPPPTSEKDLHDLILARLDAMSAERTAVVQALKKALLDDSDARPTWHQATPRREWHQPGPFPIGSPHEGDGWGVVLLIELGATPAQVVKAIGRLSSRYGSERLRPDSVAEALTAQPRDWAERFVASAATKSAPADACWAADLLIEHHHLPLPESPTLWINWLRDVPVPGPGYRWQERLLMACRLPDALQNTHDGSIDELAPRIREALGDDLRGDELVVALLAVIERGEFHAWQRNAVDWIAGLGLTDLVARHKGIAIPAVHNARTKALTFLVTQLLKAELTDPELTEVALAVLSGTSKPLRRTLLAACARITRPSDELVAMVDVAAADDDPGIAQAGKDLLAAWGRDATATVVHGLWREPTGAAPEPPAWQPRVLDEPSLHETLLGITWSLDPEPSEFRLAELVITAAARGRDVVVDAIRADIESPSSINLSLLRLLWLWANDHLANPLESDRPGDPHTSYPLGELNNQRVLSLLDGLGRVPTVLSTPDEAMMRLSWQALQDRVAQYRDADCAALAADVAVTLGRLDPQAAPADLSPFSLPIEGVDSGLDEVLAAWLTTPAAPPSLEIQDPPQEDARPRLVARGNEATTHRLLGLSTAWDEDYDSGHSGASGEEDWTLALMPHHLHRPETNIVAENHGFWPAFVGTFVSVAEVSSRFSPLLSFAALSTASDIPADQRAFMARALLEAWDRGAVTADDLVRALDHDLRDGWPLSPAKLAATCRQVAELGGLALVWPLLVAVAEEVAGAEKLTAAVGTVLEIVLALLPEVQAAGVPVALPTVATLAARKGKSKAIAAAQALTKALR
ncbi:hypothetical protein EII34_13280 [Arachnia propionica]|uniref:Uncharacterized protein n=1 Tax=Arachnia propionica TaxID=1750 RepID=A0A3P1T2J9_9ACTN|nr:hypothetical protein [Arachnia propionica]RRD03560.1 hypothetical protein EII34_13280 [Arachnia propionica]